ncbi:hypothetical protein BC943DRAFT_345620 [Umbelopsis sp. AD052]|nr:hypothetical protein BC943DRAFT_345620 [Umbelopsis sp. AD052]
MPAFTTKQIAKHNHSNSTWVIVDDKVYDVTQFLQDHPGGDDLILEHAGTDVTEIMKDQLEHEHSDAAYDLLNEHYIGTVDRLRAVEDDDEAEHYVPTNPSLDHKNNGFLDLRKPMFPQLWRSKFSKQLYLEQVHKPRYLPEPAPYFGDNHILEPLSRTPWFMVPIVWIPFVLYQLYNSSLHGAMASTVQGFSTGVFVWTLLEYTLHRFLFHMDDNLPDHWLAFLLHFTLHGIHHYLPMDKYRLVFPPVLTVIVGTPIVLFAHSTFAPCFAHAFLGGAWAAYICYDCTHYFLHHASINAPEHLKEMKKYHLAHHYKNYESGYGITSKIWDYAFSTVLQY